MRLRRGQAVRFVPPELATNLQTISWRSMNFLDKPIDAVWTCSHRSGNEHDIDPAGGALFRLGGQKMSFHTGYKAAGHLASASS